MGQINVKFDNTLKQSDIVIPLVNSSIEESGKDYKDNQPEIQQTSVHGIMSPLIMINNIVIDFDSVVEFSLKSQGPLPTLTMIVNDRFNLLATLNTPGSDNEIRVQILPQFDKAYKKINLTFYISNINIHNGGRTINLTGLYKSHKLNSSCFKSFGKINTYNLLSTIAKETQLGFASNVDDSQDERYIYCDNKNYIELMSREVSRSGGETQIYDWWVDFWNNINFADLYERYNAIDDNKDLKIWVSGQNGENREGAHIEPMEVEANLNNHPTDANTELFIIRHNIKNKTGSQVRQGTDKLYSIYFNNKFEHLDYLIQDGDVKSDIFTNFNYLGEVYGEYDYLLSEKKRTAFLQKINSESIEVVTRTPLIALMRGHRVNLTWYINDSMLDNKKNMLSKDGYLEEPNTQIPLNDTLPKEEENKINEDDGKFEIDKMISGQYLITACNIRFTNNQWEYILTLNRPASSKPKILKDYEQ